MKFIFCKHCQLHLLSHPSPEPISPCIIEPPKSSCSFWKSFIWIVLPLHAAYCSLAQRETRCNHLRKSNHLSLVLRVGLNIPNGLLEDWCLRMVLSETDFHEGPRRCTPAGRHPDKTGQWVGSAWAVQPGPAAPSCAPTPSLHPPCPTPPRAPGPRPPQQSTSASQGRCLQR